MAEKGMPEIGGQPCALGTSLPGEAIPKAVFVFIARTDLDQG
jgi:hypothetical protein